MSEAATIPTHVGFILDGNRRWARQQGLPTLEGHRRGYDNLKDIVKATINCGVSYVTAYVFSTENWNRTPKEVKYLMELAYKMLTKDVAELHEDNIRVLWLGSTERVSKKLITAIREAEALTQHNTKGTLCICFNYGGQQELADAFVAMAKSGGAEQATPETIRNFLYRPEVPDLDLLIRTSGEERTSGFMLYRAAYAELLFIKKFWPDFSLDDLAEALNVFAKRQRRFGS